MWLFFAKILLALGAFALGKLIVKGIIITVDWLKNKIKERMARRHRDQLEASVATLKKKMAEAMQISVNNGQVPDMSISDLDNLFENDGIVMADFNEDNTIDPDSIEIFTSDSVDQKIVNTLQAQGGMVKVRA